MKRSVVEKLRSLRSRGAPKGVSRTALRAAGLLAVALTVLVACGGPSGGGEPPPTIEYLLKGTVELPQGSFDEHTRMWIAEATRPTDRGGLAVQWYESVEVPVTGLVEFEVDAREMLEGIQPLDPSDVLNYMNFGTILDYTTSDSSARWKLVRDATIYQRDVAAGTADLYSHYVSGATPADRFVFRSYPVFSDRAVTITSNRGDLPGGMTVEVDVDLQQGWNMIYRAIEENSYITRSRPVTGTEEFLVLTATLDFARATDDAMAGYVVFTKHEVAAGVPRPQQTSRVSPGTVIVSARTWLSSRADNPSLVPFHEAYPGVFTSVGVTVDPPEARGAVAAVFAYDQAGTDVSGWTTNPGGSLGEMAFVSADGLRVWQIYADRTTTLTVNVDYGGNRLSTGSTGITLTHGWNFVEVRPDGPGEYTLVPTSSMSTGWSVLPR